MFWLFLNVQNLLLGKKKWSSSSKAVKWTHRRLRRKSEVLATLQPSLWSFFPYFSASGRNKWTDMGGGAKNAGLGVTRVPASSSFCTEQFEVGSRLSLERTRGQLEVCSIANVPWCLPPLSPCAQSILRLGGRPLLQPFCPVIRGSSKPSQMPDGDESERDWIAGEACGWSRMQTGAFIFHISSSKQLRVVHVARQGLAQGHPRSVEAGWGFEPGSARSKSSSRTTTSPGEWLLLFNSTLWAHCTAQEAPRPFRAPHSPSCEVSLPV